jgi:hypothetical protein
LQIKYLYQIFTEYFINIAFMITELLVS